MSDKPSDEELEAIIKPIWLKLQPSREAQAIRSSLSVEFDDPKYPEWLSDYIPDYVWDLVDIAAQRGIAEAEAKTIERCVERLAVYQADLKETEDWTDQSVHEIAIVDGAMVMLRALAEPNR